MVADALQYIELSDFSAGIFADIHAGISNAGRGAIIRNGAATIVNTYRCVADQNGALVPLPKRVVGRVEATFPPGSYASTHYPPAQTGAYIVDANVQDLFLRASGSDSTTPITVYTLWNFNYNPAATGTPYYNLWLGREYRQYVSPAATRDFFWESSNPNTFATGATGIFGGSLCDWFSYVAAGGLKSEWDSYKTGIAILAQGWFNHAAAAIVAGELPLTTFDTDMALSVGNYPSGAAATGYGGAGWPGLLAFHPDPIAYGGYTTTRNIDEGGAHRMGAIYGQYATGHQGRCVAIMGTNDARNGTDSKINQRLYYTTSGDLTVITDTSVLNANPENTSGIGIIASANTDELLVINNRGGGYTVRGDMSNPTITTLRSIESVYGVLHSPAYTPIGIVYMSPNGVFVWQGGETTPKLSTQLDANFWEYATPGEMPNLLRHSPALVGSTRPNKGRLTWFHPWVCVPNSYLYDTNLKSWWRLEASTTNNNVPYSVYDTDAQTGKLFAFPYKLCSGQAVVWDEYDSDVQASTYSWNSQPLFETQDRMSSVQELVLTAAIPTNVPVGDVISMDGVAGTFVTTPDAAVLDLTQDMEITCRVALTDWTSGVDQGLVAKDDGGAQRSYGLAVTATGFLQHYTFSPGVLANTSTVALPFIDGNAYWVRVTFDGNNAGNRIANFYYAADSVTEPTVWTQLGATVTTAGVSSATNTTSALRVGALGTSLLPATGKFYRAIVRNATTGGAVVADMNADTATSASTWVSATSGETWTKGGTALYVDAQVVTVTLTGYNPDGTSVTPVTHNFVLGQSTGNPQQMTKVVTPNFNAMHVQCRIQGIDSSYSPAPKVIALKIGTAPTRGHLPRTQT